MASSDETQEQTLDLGALEGHERFNPYLAERNDLWALLPVMMLVLVLLHLRKTKKDARGFYKTGAGK